MEDTLHTHKLGTILSSKELDDLDRLTMVATKGCEDDRDLQLVAEAIALVTHYRAASYAYVNGAWTKVLDRRVN